MTTFKDLAEKHATSKKCMGACGERKPLTKEYWYGRVRYREQGQVISWQRECRECVNAKTRKTYAENQSCENAWKKKIPVFHTGPLDKPGRLFFCDIKPTPLGEVLRNLKREARTL